MLLSEKIGSCAISLTFAGLAVFLGYFAERADFMSFIAAYWAFFSLYVWPIFFKKNKSQAEMRWHIGLGIALRVLLLFSVPNLSDDFYRFLWDGHLTTAGLHPFVHPPSYFVENQIFPRGITPELFSKLNSPDYFTVYPPVCQAVFALAAWLSPANEWGGVLAMKLFLLACEIGTIKQLATALGRGSSPSELCNLQLFYALNPLIIFEIVGNCHFEGAMIFFLLAGLRALEQNKVKRGALWWALATASKLLPLMFLPIVLCWLGWRKGLIFSAVFAAVCLILFAPLLGVLPNILSSLDLYFRQFQFNASFYYLFREIGFWKIGWDIGESLGPFLGAVTMAGVLAIAWKSKGKALADALLFALMLQLSLAATVHSWYATVPFALGLFTRWRFPVLWTGLVALSYSHYAGGFFQENFWFIALEYSALWGFFLWEIRKRKAAYSAV